MSGMKMKHALRIDRAFVIFSGDIYPIQGGLLKACRGKKPRRGRGRRPCSSGEKKASKQKGRAE